MSRVGSRAAIPGSKPAVATTPDSMPARLTPKPDLEYLQRAVHNVNQLIKEYQGSVGFSLEIDRDTGVLIDVIAHPFAGVPAVSIKPTPPELPPRPYPKVWRT